MAEQSKQAESGGAVKVGEVIRTRDPKRRRRGRLEVTVEGKRYHVEMTRMGITVRAWHARRRYVFKPEDLVALAMAENQLEITFDSHL